MMRAQFRIVGKERKFNHHGSNGPAVPCYCAHSHEAKDSRQYILMLYRTRRPATRNLERSRICGAVRSNFNVNGHFVACE